MKTNIETIRDVIDYIELHLDDKLDLDCICREIGYSKYHLSRMFASVVGFSMHNYIQRRRLTEAARMLISTETPIMEIALSSGYETQQSFTTGFESFFKCSPNAFRKKKDFYPLQLKFSADGIDKLKGDKIMDIKVIDSEKILLIGYKRNTRNGFQVIGECWQGIHLMKQNIPNRKNTDFLIGLNDYSDWDMEDNHPAFDYYAASQVERIHKVPEGMEAKELPQGKYVVFTFRACCQDSLEPVSNYIYKEWFPNASCQLNENARFDFARYGEEVDEDGKSTIEYYVPILS